MSAKISIVPKSSQLSDEMENFLKIPDELPRADSAVGDICHSASTNQLLKQNSRYIPPPSPSEISSESGSIYTDLLIGALGVPLGVMGGIGSAVGGVFISPPKEESTEILNTSLSAPSSSVKMTPSRTAGNNKPGTPTAIDSLKTSYSVFISEWHEVVELFDDIFNNYVNLMEEPSWGWNIVFTSSDQTNLREHYDVLLTKLISKGIVLKQNLTKFITAGQAYVVWKTEEDLKAAELENLYATARFECLFVSSLS